MLGCFGGENVGFTTWLGVFVVNKFVLQHVCALFVSNVGFTACLGVFGVKMLVSQHVWMFFGCI